MREGESAGVEWSKHADGCMCVKVTSYILPFCELTRLIKVPFCEKLY